ncbi:putative Sodium/bile acid cotransporter [Seiridium cardinale]
MAKHSPDDAGAAKHENAVVKTTKAILKFCLDNWLVFGFGIATLLAYFFPNVAAKGGIIRSEYSILYGAIALIFLINGMQLSPQKLKQHINNWRLHFIVQGIGFVIIPVLMLVVIRIVVAAGGLSSGTIDVTMLVGMVVVSAIPTTIASNVVMTRNSGGDEAAAIIEVVIGNVLGPFIAPGLTYGFIPVDAGFGQMRPASPSTLGPMYASVMKQLGLSVLIPLAVGQGLRWTWSKKVEWTLKTFRLAKLCSLCMVLLVWATFSGAFKSGALYDLPKSSVIFNVFMNLALYMVFTVVCYYAAYPPDLLCRLVNTWVVDSKLGVRLPSLIRRAITVRKMPKDQVVAVCLCGAAKTQALGIPLADAMWAQSPDLTRSLIQIPILLYTMEQVFAAQFLTILLRWWLQRDKKRVLGEDSEAMDENQEGQPVPGNGKMSGGIGQERTSHDLPVLFTDEKAVA